MRSFIIDQDESYLVITKGLVSALLENGFTHFQITFEGATSVLPLNEKAKYYRVYYSGGYALYNALDGTYSVHDEHNTRNLFPYDEVHCLKVWLAKRLPAVMNYRRAKALMQIGE